MPPVTLELGQLIQLGTLLATIVLSYATAKHLATQALREAREARRVAETESEKVRRIALEECDKARSVANAAHARLDKHRTEQQTIQLTLQDLKTRLELLPATTSAAVLEKLVAAGVYGKPHVET